MLERELSSVLGDRAPVAVLGRSPNSYSSTFPSEVVTCAVGSSTIEVLCKYDLAWAHDVNGRRAGPLYEADVYRVAVEPSGLSAPTFFGVSRAGGNRRRWLMVKHVTGGVRVNKATGRDAIVRAAAWIGAFHRFHELEQPGLEEGLNHNDEDYFVSCVRRALSNSASVHGRHPWLERLAHHFETQCIPLLLQRRTVIHGEFYPENVIIKRGVVYPVDWERAAVSAGEIDIAALTEGRWMPRSVAKAVEAYAYARWRDLRPGDFESRLEAARTYLNFRAFDDDPLQSSKPHGIRRLQQLRAAAERLNFA